jgi:4-diphosphocytidyl-2-C-methyl-D-erythritol kinase
MGGFAGGDEGGYWDIDIPPSSMVKHNDNISKSRNRAASYIERSDSGYSIKAHTKVKGLYDTISFVPCECETFTIEGCDDIPLELNSIYKAYKALLDFTDDLDIVDFFYAHKIVVTKGIPLQVGLRGAASDAAAFILLVKEVCNLILCSDELANIGSTVGADVPFFIHNYHSDDILS